MRGWLSGAGALALLCFGQVSGQCDDPFDKVLCASALAPEQAAQFSASDGRVSGFWAGLTGDYVELVPPTNCAIGLCGFSGPADATMTVKAAGTSKGLYLYVEVEDNAWVDWPGGESWGDDAVDLFFDRLDANTIWNCTDCRAPGYCQLCTYTTQQMQVFMGSAAPPSRFRFMYYDDDDWALVTLNMAFADARANFGFEAEVVVIDATHKAQEWFLPWDRFGTLGFDVGAPLGGVRVGFAGGYNDMDGDNTVPDCLRWPLADDPWAGDRNYWGEILLASDMGTVEASSTAVSRPVRAARTAAVPQRTPYGPLYTLRGERLPSREAFRTAGVTVQQVRPGAAIRRVSAGW